MTTDLLLFVAFCWSDVQLLVKAQVFLLLHFIVCLAYLQGDHLSGKQTCSCLLHFILVTCS